LPIRIFHVFGLLLLGLLGGFALATSIQRGQAQGNEAVVRAVPSSLSVSASTDKIDVAIEVENVSNLAGFQFFLAVNPDVLRLLSADKTPFLAQSGREIVCRDPVIQEGVVLFACVTLRPTPAGVDGNGTIATVSVKPLGSGRSSLTLSKVTLVHPDGSVLPIVVTNGELTILRTGFFTVGRILLIAGGAVALIGVALAVVWRLRSAGRAQPPEAESATGNQVHPA
jgi:hypothetical protein